MDEIPDYKRSMPTDVEIFVAGSPNPIRTSALLLADSSPMLASLLHQISFCAGRADFLSFELLLIEKIFQVVQQPEP